eukprot:Gregarina_sp_Pseudo_9__4430@NODE_458_length_2800_cov_30_069540_g434_i0_p2_GENE_NODE_458_length_2800_cov_30_069540_g434_i0NODE_458_length_2800_cov_30_069540_g434_i0_p2_ORF_typecomplete_len223_score21_06_NODE_458_length_2800_cov_30_069540_g434_i0144812
MFLRFWALVSSAEAVWEFSFSNAVISYDFCPDVCKQLRSKTGLIDCIKRAPPDCTGRAQVHLRATAPSSLVCLHNASPLYFATALATWNPGVLFPGLVKDDTLLPAGNTLTISFASSATKCDFDLFPTNQDSVLSAPSDCGISSVGNAAASLTRTSAELVLSEKEMNQLQQSEWVLFKSLDAQPECQEPPNQFLWQLVLEVYWTGKNWTALAADFGGLGRAV